MTNVNNFAIIGHLTADAEEFNIGNNTYVSFRVAVNRGQNKDASFIPVRAPKRHPACQAYQGCQRSGFRSFRVRPLREGWSEEVL